MCPRQKALAICPDDALSTNDREADLKCAVSQRIFGLLPRVCKSGQLLSRARRGTTKRDPEKETNQNETQKTPKVRGSARGEAQQ